MTSAQLRAYVALLSFVAGALFVDSLITGQWVWAAVNSGSFALLIHYLEELT